MAWNQISERTWERHDADGNVIIVSVAHDLDSAADSVEQALGTPLEYGAWRPLEDDDPICPFTVDDDAWILNATAQATV